MREKLKMTRGDINTAISHATVTYNNRTLTVTSIGNDAFDG